jgi:hypothetical protein
VPRFDRLTYSQHALERLGEHKLTDAIIRATLNRPHNEYVSRGNDVAEILTSNGSTIRVVYTEVPSVSGGKALHVITVVRMKGDRMKRGRR